jgi:hypothetical protein
MPAEYFHRWMDLLLARLEPGEWVLARGRAFEPTDALRFDLSTVISGPGCAVAVTERCVLWVSSDDDRWVRSLPFALVRSSTEFTQAHRYALALDHQRIDRPAVGSGASAALVVLGQRRGGPICQQQRAGV